MTLDQIWVAWDRVTNDWFCDIPVILVIGGLQLEVSVHKLDELYLSFDAIDRSAPFGWADDGEWDLEWRCNPPIVERTVLGRRVTGFGSAEYAFQLADFVGTLPWVLVSLEVELEDGAHFAIENALDENSLRFRSPEERSDLRVRWFEPSRDGIEA